MGTKDNATQGIVEMWPELRQSDWSDTCATLHLWMQMLAR